MIPAPFFDATTRNYCIENGLMRSQSAMRDVKRGEIWLGGFKLPPFQRARVWEPTQSARFIESIWLGLPIGVYVVNRDDREHLGYPCDDWLLDGQQRWAAIMDYVNDWLPVFGLRFSELDIVKQRKFKKTGFSALETRDLTKQQCEEVYNRLAYGGTPHPAGHRPKQRG